MLTLLATAAFGNAAPVFLPPCAPTPDWCPGGVECKQVTYEHTKGGVDRSAVHDRALADGFGIACEGDGFFVLARVSPAATAADTSRRCATTSVPAGLLLLALALVLPRRRG